jgi:hypothetical protein
MLIVVAEETAWRPAKKVDLAPSFFIGTDEFAPAAHTGTLNVRVHHIS